MAGISHSTCPIVSLSILTPAVPEASFIFLATEVCNSDIDAVEVMALAAVVGLVKL